ncbi:MAG: hypothetical protein ABEJ40_04400 [Haloarculaceae archaeon]
MKLRDLAVAAAAGVAAFLVVTVLVTELAAPSVEFSLFLGLPAGAIAGLSAFALVALGLGDDLRPRRRRRAVAVGAFGVVFLVVAVVEVAVLGATNSVALAVGTIVGAGVGAYAYVRAG